MTPLVYAIVVAALSAAAVLVVQQVFARVVLRQAPDRANMVGLASIVFGAVFGGIFADQEFGVHIGGAFLGGGIGFLLAGISTGLFKR